MRLSCTAIRYADAADLPLIEAIEVAADERFVAVSEQAGIDPALFPGIGASVAERVGAPGFLLVAGQPALGFAHVVEIDGHLLLEQLSVTPAAGGLGLGSALVRAALGVALDRGHETVYLRTFADVAWNGPFYRRLGFAEVPDPPWAASLVAAEQGARLARWGRRITMAAAPVDEPRPAPAVSVIPLREGPEGLETFVQHRVATMDFAAGAVVFPGGRVDPLDRAGLLAVPDEVLDRHAERWAATNFRSLGASARGAARTILAAGVREVREEAAAEIDPAELLPWDNWVTPIGSARRFDVYFVLAPVSAHAAGAWRHTTTEAHDSHWITVASLAQRAERRDLLLLPPTRAIVDELAALGVLSQVLALAPRIRATRHDIDVRRPRGGTR